MDRESTYIPFLFPHDVLAGYQRFIQSFVRTLRIYDILPKIAGLTTGGAFEQHNRIYGLFFIL